MALVYDNKAEREVRLRGQSALLLATVLPVAMVWLAVECYRTRTPATAEGVAICALFGLLVWRLRAATPLASLTGFILTACIYLGTVDQPSGSWRHTALLPGLALFVLAFAATRFRRGRKERLGTAESRRGRAASQVAANMGVAALFAMPLPNAHSAALLAAITAALAEAAADTVSSEIGQVLGGTPILLTTLKRVPPGTDGAISLAGTLAGCIAAAILVLGAVPTLRLDLHEAVIAGAAAICGLFFDSLVGATLERQGRLNNDAVNFLSTMAAAGLAFSLVRLST